MQLLVTLACFLFAQQIILIIGGNAYLGGSSLLCSFPMDLNIEYVDEDPDVKTEEERRQRFGQIDHNRVFGRKAGELLEQAGFAVESIRGEDCPEEILPVIGPADYDKNNLFWCMRR